MYIQSKIIKVTTATIMMLCQTVVFAQNSKYDLKDINETIERLTIENKIDSLVKYTHDLSIHFYRKKDFQNAIVYSKKEVALGAKAQSLTKYKNAIFNLGLFYLRNKQFHHSIKTHEMVIDSFETDVKTYQSFCEIGRNYRRLGDFHQSIFYLEKGLEHPELFTLSNLSVNYRNLAAVYDLGNINVDNFLEKKYVLLQKIDSINKITEPSESILIRNNISFGDYYTNDEIFNFDKAKTYYSLALKKSLKIKDSSLSASLYNKLGYIYRFKKNDSCSYYLEQVARYAHPNGANLSQAYFELERYHAEKGNYKLALKYAHKELALTLPEEIDSSFYYAPTINLLSQSNNKIQAFFALKGKIENSLEWYTKLNNQKHLELGLKHLDLADKLVDIIKTQSIQQNSKLFWQQEASKVYMLGITASFLSKDINKAFYFMEKRKAILLLENLTESKLKENSNIAIDILEKEFAIKQNILNLENQLNDDYYTNKDSIKQLYNTAKINYAQFIKSLEQKYPEYYNYKAPVNITSLKAVKETLDNTTVIIEYVLDKTNGYVMYVSRTKTELYKLNNINDIHKIIASFNKRVSKPFNTSSDEADFKEISNNLYNSLIPKSEEDIFKGKSKLTIVPDYVLQTVPYEALQTNLNNHYLIKDFEVTYAYSMSFLQKNSKTNREATKEFIGFAPGAFNTGLKLEALPYSTQELEHIATSIDGTFLLDNFSTKENFISNLSDYKIIHLATHANSNDSITPWVAFKKKKLLLNELYIQKNQADLVVLSACNTGLGDIKEGEGVFSLARGFFYSGSNSVISSLWQVNDKSSSKIMGDFYKNLKDGDSKASALRKAKLNYLESQSLSDSSPYYWSSFILIGDSNEILLEQNNLLLYSVVFIIVFLLILYLMYSKKRSNI